MNPILYDTTLRDGTQREGLSLSAEDKVRIACRLDTLGIGYIEGGWPGSNPKDAEFFRRIADVSLHQAKIAAFGMTRHAGGDCADDGNCRALVEAGTPVVTLVGKSSTLHVDRVLRTSRDENLRMIAETVARFKRLGKEVIYDAEHFARGARAGLVAPGLIVVGHAHGDRDLVLLAVERRQRRPIVAYFGPHDGIRPRADVQRRRATA